MRLLKQLLTARNLSQQPSYTIPPCAFLHHRLSCLNQVKAREKCSICHVKLHCLMNIKLDHIMATAQCSSLHQNGYHSQHFNMDVLLCNKNQDTDSQYETQGFSKKGPVIFGCLQVFHNYHLKCYVDEIPSRLLMKNAFKIAFNLKARAK